MRVLVRISTLHQLNSRKHVKSVEQPCVARPHLISSCMRRTALSTTSLFIHVYSIANSVDSVDAPREFHFSEIRTPLQNTQCRMFLCLFDRTKECSRKHCQFFKKYTTKHRWGTEKKWVLVWCRFVFNSGFTSSMNHTFFACFPLLHTWPADSSHHVYIAWHDWFYCVIRPSTYMIIHVDMYVCNVM